MILFYLNLMMETKKNNLYMIIPYKKVGVNFEKKNKNSLYWWRLKALGKSLYE